MANEKASAFPAAGALTGTEGVPIVQSGANKLATAQAIANLAPGGGGSVSVTAASGNIIVSPSPGTGTFTIDANTGTTANKIIKLDGSAKLPAVDGSQLTNLPSGGPVSVTGASGDIIITPSPGTGTFTVGANTGTSANQIVKLNSSAKLPPVDGSLLTNLPGGLSGMGSGIVSGGTTSRNNDVRFPERGMLVTELGVDCTGATDATSALQAAINAVPDNSNLVVPHGSVIKLSSTINIRNRVGLRLISDIRVKNAAPSPQFTWAATGGTAFSFFCCDHPGFEGFLCNGASGLGCPDTWLLFDGENGVAGGTKTPTQAKVSRCTFLSNFGNASYKCIQISPTANQNHEDYEVSDCDIFGYGVNNTARRAVDGVTTMSATSLTSATAAFVSGDAGKRIIVSCSVGSLTTTIASVTNGTTIVLGANWTLASQTGATIHIGTNYGVGIYQAGNNSFATRFINITCSYLAIGLSLNAGSNGKIEGYGGGFNDLGINMVGGWDLDRYDCEGDIRAIEVQGVNRPNRITSMRMPILYARADGWILMDSTCNLSFQGGFIDGTPVANSLLFANYGGSPPSGKVFSSANFYYPASVAQTIGTTHWVSMQDVFNVSAANSIKSILLGLPTADPHIAGELWNNSTALTVSAG